MTKDDQTRSTVRDEFRGGKVKIVDEFAGKVVIRDEFGSPLPHAPNLSSAPLTPEHA